MAKRRSVIVPVASASLSTWVDGGRPGWSPIAYEATWALSHNDVELNQPERDAVILEREATARAIQRHLETWRSEPGYRSHR